MENIKVGGRNATRRPTSITLPPQSIPVSVLANPSGMNPNSTHNEMNQVGAQITNTSNSVPNNGSGAVADRTIPPHVGINPQQQFVAQQHALLRQRNANFVSAPYFQANLPNVGLANPNLLGNMHINANPLSDLNANILAPNGQRVIFNQHQKQLAFLKLKNHSQHQNLVIGPRPAPQSLGRSNSNELNGAMFHSMSHIPNMTAINPNGSFPTTNNNPLWTDDTLNAFNSLNPNNTNLDNLPFSLTNDNLVNTNPNLANFQPNNFMFSNMGYNPDTNQFHPNNTSNDNNGNNNLNDFNLMNSNGNLHGSMATINHLNKSQDPNQIVDFDQFIYQEPMLGLSNEMNQNSANSTVATTDDKGNFSLFTILIDLLY